VTANLAFPDTKYPDVRSAQYETVIEATGASLASGCSAAGAPGTTAASALLLLGLFALALGLRRRG
jgi:MYXO-CTERM domain-containing protein